MTESSCTYRQVFKVTPLLGGFTTFNNDFAKSKFKSIVWQDGGTIVAKDNNIKVTVGAKSLTFYRALIVFRDNINIGAGIEGCASVVDITEAPPTILINGEDRVTLNVGTIIIANNGKLIARTFMMPSYSDVSMISKSVFDYIFMKNSVGSYWCSDNSFNVTFSRNDNGTTSVSMTLNNDGTCTGFFSTWSCDGRIPGNTAIVSSGAANIGYCYQSGGIVYSYVGMQASGTISKIIPNMSNSRCTL